MAEKWHRVKSDNLIMLTATVKLIPSTNRTLRILKNPLVPIRQIIFAVIIFKKIWRWICQILSSSVFLAIRPIISMLKYQISRINKKRAILEAKISFC